MLILDVGVWGSAHGGRGAEKTVYIMLYWGVELRYVLRGSIAAYGGTALALHNYLTKYLPGPLRELAKRSPIWGTCSVSCIFIMQ